MNGSPPSDGGSAVVGGTTKPGSAALDAVDRLARQVLLQHGAANPETSFEQSFEDEESLRAAHSTCLMDLYRRTGSADVFEVLVRVAIPQLRKRVQTRTRFLGARVDPNEVLQDAVINIYRYPGNFDGQRAGAFRAWSNTIVDNAIRRHLRNSRSGPDVQVMADDVLARQAAREDSNPGIRAIQAEGCSRIAESYRLLLALYFSSYSQLSDRERFVLQMVEVRGMRYAELAQVMGIRPEALKMVVFRARRRIHQRISGSLVAAA